MTNQRRLLLEYAETGSETAFRELVTRYVDLVYSTAVRLLEGDQHRAEDVVQTVFADLARKARTLSSGVLLGGWLHRHTCFVAATTLRGERRRQNREREAVAMNAIEDHSEANLARITPLLDDAINTLGDKDRTAILLRFFERHDFRTIGHSLGCDEDAAQKRVSRALEKLHTLLQRRGVSYSVAALGAWLTSSAVTAAPTGLAVNIATATFAGGAVAGATFTLLNLMTMTKLKLGIIGTVVAAGVATPLVMQHQVQARLRAENLALHRQIDALTALQAENERLAALAAQQREAQGLAEERLGQLLKLRNEVNGLRQQTNELNRAQAENRQLQAALNQARKSPSPARNPADNSAESSFPRDKWAFVGYGTPENAAVTMAWAAMNYDLNVITNSLAPEAKAMVDKLIAEGRFEKEFLAGMREDVSGIESYQIVNREELPGDMLRLTVTIPGKKDRHPLLKRVGNEWKFLRFN